MRNRVSPKIRLRQAVARKTAAVQTLSNAARGNTGSGASSSEHQPSQPTPATRANWPGTSHQAQGWLCGQARSMITMTNPLQTARPGSSRCRPPK